MKRKLNKWLSGVLAACVLFTTVPVYAINDVSGTETSTEVVETSEETQSSEVETLSTEETIQESSESAETTSEESSKPQASETADEMLNISPTDLGDEEEPSTDNWELSTVFYDSTVDNGKTPLTSIDWDASDGSYKEGTPRVITVQINYKNTNAVTTYQPGDLEISIPNLCYSNSRISGTAYDAQWSTKIIVGANDSTHTGYAWDFTTGNSPTTSQKTFTFTNTNTIEENANFEGNIQIIYTITPDIETPENGQEECTHNFSKELQATLNQLISTESIRFTYKRTYIHPWIKSTYYMNEYANKITSYDGLGENAEEYIWVAYDFIDTTENNNFYMYKYPAINVRRNSGEYRNSFPNGCIVYDNAGNLLTPQTDGTYIFDKTLSRGPSYSWYGYSRDSIRIFVGYPKSIYNEENNNLIITNPVELWGAYGNNVEKEYLHETTITLNLSDFMFQYPPGLYGITKKLNNNSALSDLYYQNIIAETTNYNWNRWKIDTTSYYTGYPLTVKTGDDLLFRTDKNGENIRFSDSEYYFEQIRMDNISNSNGNLVPDNKYDCELWVRYKNSDKYILYTTFKNADKTWTFTREQGIVGYYIIVKDANEGINYSTYVYTKYLKADIPEQGEIYNFSYIEVYNKDTDGNLIKQNIISEDNYSNITTKENIATFDMNTYGYYQQRAYDKDTWEKKNVSTPTAKFLAQKSAENIIQNATNEVFEGNYNIGIKFYGPYGGGNSDEDILFYFDDYDPAYAIQGFYIYDLLPLGMENISSEEEIINSISLYNHSSKIYDINQKSISNTELIEMIKRGATVDFSENWNNTGRTKITIKVDFSARPFYTWEKYNSGGTDYYQIMFNIKYQVSYDSFLEHGNIWENYCYVNKLETQEKGVNIFGVSDNGTYDKNAYDINENGDVTEKLSYSKATATITSVVSTHQDVQTQVQSTLSNYSTGIVNAEYDKNYSYKLRVRSGENDVTNLVIYDNLEKWAKDKDGNFIEAAGKKQYWQGEFLGIDTSYAESKGYTVKVYYSENEKAGTLTEDTSWKEYSDTVDKTKVKSLAFQYLDSEGNPAILPANSLTYVEINMKAPADEKITTLAYNGCWTQWNALDDFGQPVDFITGINSNIVKVALPNSIIDDELPTVTLKFIKEISGTDSDFENMLLDKAEERNFKITLTSLTANEDGSYNQITGLLSSTQGLTLSKVPIGTYLITESDNIYFDFVEMVPNNDEEIIIEGVTLEKTAQGYVLTISDDLSGDVEFNIKVTNKIEPDRPYEDKEEIENLFKIPSVDA